MEKIKITSSDQFYEIKSIRQTAEHVLQIVFAGAVPESWGDIQLYTEGGVLATILIGWHTVYRNEGRRCICQMMAACMFRLPIWSRLLRQSHMSRHLQSCRRTKKQEISAACEQEIYSGVDVTFADGSAGAFFSDRTRSAQFIRQAGAACGWRGTVGIPFRWTGLPILQRHRYAVDHRRGDAVCIVSHYLLQCHQYVDLRMREYKRTPGNLLRSGYSEKYQSDVLKSIYCINERECK